MLGIQTVTGTIAPDELGVTYMHEHLLCDQRLCRADGLRQPGTEGNLMVLNDPVVAVQEMTEIRGLGVDAAGRSHDAGVGPRRRWASQDFGTDRNQSGRDVRVLRRAVPSGMGGRALHRRAGRRSGPGDRVGGRNVRDPNRSAEIGISRPVVEGPEEKCARAVARAQLATGATITTHTSGASRFEILGGNIGPLLLDVLRVRGRGSPAGDHWPHRRKCGRAQSRAALPARRLCPV